jgi:hypothetical protein
MKNIYIEKKIGSLRRFEIDDEQLRIHQESFLDPEIDSAIDLKILKPEPDTVLYKKFRFASVTSLFIIILILFSIIWRDLNFLGYKSQVIHSAEIYFLVYLGILFNTRKEIEYKAFPNKDEIIIIDIGKIGQYEKEFDEFIQLIIDKIKAEQSGGKRPT